MAAAFGMLAAGTIVGSATLAVAQADVVKQRQENRKQTAAAMRAIKGVIDSKGDAKIVVQQAAKLKELEAAFVKMFPAGSDKDSKALPAVWSDQAGFQAASKAADAAYDKLAVAGGSGDFTAIATAFQDTGKACGACHQKFRAKDN
ncbi:Cytochrome c556 [Enhydrobacter aerosaccus]|uniref:Cytochrome c556 n=1 Tax=Enhydrobacter aerosaccus TaxID=225324 RepID=A0A1T4R5D4_9HYPH|nr:Cytochrome c556 [Enhydrobacter aerosaccus]